MFSSSTKTSRNFKFRNDIAHKYYVIYKPFQVLSQFSPEEGKKTLKDFFDVETDVYPVGRLDYDSEGLLILTNDKRLNHNLLNPKKGHKRTYWVQVEGDITNEAIAQLSAGVRISINGKKHHTRPALAQKLDNVQVAERNPPIRFRQNIPTSWLALTLAEGKNRQVRRMTSAVGYPTLRLIRHNMEDLFLDNLQPGEMKSYDSTAIYRLLKIK